MKWIEIFAALRAFVAILRDSTSTIGQKFIALIDFLNLLKPAVPLPGDDKPVMMAAHDNSAMQACFAGTADDCFAYAESQVGKLGDGQIFALLLAGIAKVLPDFMALLMAWLTKK